MQDLLHVKEAVEPGTQTRFPRATSLPVSLESVITTEQLFVRESRAPDYESETRALEALMEVMAATPSTILQRLVDTTLELCNAHSAGISILETSDGEEVFKWRATAGSWRRFAGGALLRSASPCGTVLERNASLLFCKPQLHFDLPKELQPQIEEALLVPFRVLGNSVGTLWVVSHDESRRFDAEDWRLLSSLARFAANAYQILTGMVDLNAANGAKVEFLAAMSHDARTPLNSITGYLDLLALGVHGPINSEQLNDVARIRKSTDLLQVLVNDVLSFAHLEAGRLEIRITDVQPREVLESACAVCDVKARESGVLLVRDKGTIPEPVRADPIRLEQILINLIENATQRAKPQGEVVVSYTIDRSCNRGFITVRDSGSVTAEALSHIFDPFVRDSTQSDGESGSSGLALAMTRKLAREMDGDITISSAPGQGPAFVVALPLSQVLR